MSRGMALKLVAATVLGFSAGLGDAGSVVASTTEKTRVFYQTRGRDHRRAMDSIMHNMTLDAALADVRKGSASPEVLAMLKDAFASQVKHHHVNGAKRSSKSSRSLRPAPELVSAIQAEPEGYAGVAKAKAMLNEMIEEVQEKYETELESCCHYDEKQSSLMEQCRQDISMFNAEAAEAREEMLGAQTNIDICEKKLPDLMSVLELHNQKCKEEISDLEEQLKIVLADIEVMNTVLEMTDCGKGAAQLLLLACEDECTGKTIVSFDHPVLKSKASALQSPSVRSALQSSLAEVFSNLDGKPAAGEKVALPPPAMPAPRTLDSSGPCKPAVPEDKRMGKCSIKTNPKCEKIQEKFMGIQTGIVDKKYELQAELERLETLCEETKKNLEAQIDDFETRLKENLVALAGATKKNAGAEEQSRLKSGEFVDLKKDYAGMTVLCHENYDNYESEECGLKKIRGELYKMQGADHPAFFQDCVTTDWSPEECTVSCGKGGGTQVLRRTVAAFPIGGAACPPLEKMEKCNDHLCPIDCVVNDWAGWSKCTAECGGGVMERLRSALIEPEHGGDPCGETSEAENCNAQSCDKDCVLADWSEWSDCSKQCNSGSRERKRDMLEDVQGEGTCAEVESEHRLQSKPCNSEPCKKLVPDAPTLQCNDDVDVVMLLDGSGSIGEAGWEATKKAGAMMARAFPDEKELDVEFNAFDGCPMMNENVVEAFAKDKVEKARVRCCSNDGTQCKTAELGACESLNERTLDEAHTICKKQNMRLCTELELNSNICCGTGCDTDGSLVWVKPPGVAKLSVILYSGPRYWSQYDRCVGAVPEPPDMEADCFIFNVAHFTTKTDEVATTIENLAWPKSTTLTSVALDQAETELGLGRSYARSIVIVFTDGAPMSAVNTGAAAERLRKKARVVWVPVTRWAPLADIKKWASFPQQENIIPVDDWAALEDPALIDNLISGVCKNVY